MTTYDLSQSIREDTPVYPGDPPVECRSLATVSDDGYRTTRVALDTHSGTHVDAPAHMVADGRTIDSYDPETFRFTASVLDVSSLDSRSPLGADRLQAAIGAEPDRAVDLLALYTGWDRHWGTDHYFDHPYITGDAATLIAERDCHVAVDTPNVDPTQTTNASADEPDGYPAHHAMFEADRVIVENLRGLDRLPAGDEIDIDAYPLKIADGDAAPVRAVART